MIMIKPPLEVLLADGLAKRNVKLSKRRYGYDISAEAYAQDADALEAGDKWRVTHLVKQEIRDLSSTNIHAALFTSVFGTASFTDEQKDAYIGSIPYFERTSEPFNGLYLKYGIYIDSESDHRRNSGNSEVNETVGIKEEEFVEIYHVKRSGDLFSVMYIDHNDGAKQYRVNVEIWEERIENLEGDGIIFDQGALNGLLEIGGKATSPEEISAKLMTFLDNPYPLV